jgi:DNA gyrase inhibitor GyrI
MASNPSLDVSTIEMAGWRVAYLTYQTSQTSGDFDHAIRRTFDRVKTWVREQGGTVDTVPAIGIASVQDGKLQSYECCIPISENLSPDEDSALDVKVLPGGKYVIVKIEKQSEIIGETIRRFIEEYVPNTNLQIDNSRPTYEVYWNTTMDFCVPILV